MADCGASGSALDRAVSAAVSGGGGGRHAASAGAAEAVASFLGGAAAASSSTSSMAVMPSAPPELLYGGRPQPATTTMPPPPAAAASAMGNAMLDEAWRDGEMMRHEGGRMMRHAPPPHHQHRMVHHPHHIHPHQQIQMQMNMQQMQMMRQQQMMMMAQQQHHRQQMMMAQQQQQQARQAQQEAGSMEATSRRVEGGVVAESTAYCTEEGAAARAVPMTATGETDVASSNAWHDGLEEDVRSTLRSYRAGSQEDDVVTTHEDDDEQEVLGHEGLAEGASIEELARAWAEAEAEYGAETAAATAAEATEAAVDLGSAYHQEGPDGNAELAPYNFSEESRTYRVSPTAVGIETAASSTPDVDLFEEGMRHFRAGNLREAILSFESELRNVDPDNADAWRMLGRCHAENDEDRRAIACLERAVDRDPYSAEALLALGVSYVNELDHERALRSLKAWITHNPTYAGMEVPPSTLPSKTDEAVGGVDERGAEERSRLDEVRRLLLRALEYDPTAEAAADVNEALGVAYNVSRDYDKAVDAFQSAIDARPNDYQLWNKLGATLANSNRSEDALPAYHEALRLKPRYARAWLNMAISHSNLHNYDEAARCYLQTLSLNPSATHCWSYLRIALTCSERWDLLPLAASQNLEGFRAHFDFVEY